jgi:high-affinity iron transporter
VRTAALPLVIGLMFWACQSAPPAPAAPVAPAEPLDGARVYARQCATCHGAEGRGDGPLAAQNQAPSLHAAAAGGRLEPEVMHALLLNGRGAMPAFPNLSSAERAAVIAWVRERTGAAPAEGSGAAP